jgi:hypothetical protein
MRQRSTTIMVKDADRRNTELTTAVTAAMELAARDKRCGILVTRHELSRFTVALTPEVPFGIVQECDLIGSPPQK